MTADDEAEHHCRTERSAQAAARRNELALLA